MNSFGDVFWLLQLVLCAAVQGISIPFFSSFRKTTTVGTTTTTPLPPHPPIVHSSYYPYLRDQRIINADHGGIGLPSPTSHAGGGVAYSPWTSGTKDQYIRNQLVIVHPEAPLNKETWKENGYFNPAFDPTPRKAINASSTPKPAPARPSQPTPLLAPSRARKLNRKSKQHEQDQANIAKQTEGEVVGIPSNVQLQHSSTNGISSNTNPFLSVLEPERGGFYDIPAPVLLRDDAADDVTPIISSLDPILVGNDLFFPITAPIYPYQTRTAFQQQTLPPEAVIQLLKSPQQELSPLTRPQVKLPFPLSRDCSASSGGSGSKPLQFVVLPIVEPVAPLKPIFPKPSFLSSQYGQFPYIPPFNLFQKPPVPPSQDSPGGTVPGGSGQFVPILNRPAPPLPFVFVQSLPLELIGQNTDMDVIHSAAPSTTSENRIKEVPIAAPLPPLPPKQTTPPSTSPLPLTAGPTPVENIPVPSVTRPLPLIVIEKVKIPGQPPSAPVAPAAAVVEISKQSIQNNANSGAPPLSTISVVQPITGNKVVTPQQHQEIQKAIEKLVPVAAAVLENVEKQQLKQKEQGRDRDISSEGNANKVAQQQSTTAIPVGENSTTISAPVKVTIPNERDKQPLRPPLRPEISHDSVIGGIPPITTKSQFKKPDISSSEETGAGSSIISGVEVTEV